MKNNYLIIGLIVIVFIGGLWFLGSSQRPTQDNDTPLISTTGIHYHPQLSIFINDEQITIPAGIGLAVGHNPMHTHEEDGVIHLEYDGRVYEGDTTLGRFFDVWNKDFSQTKLLDTEGEVVMTVNGEVNTEFGNYQMKDGDRIELRI